MSLKPNAKHTGYEDAFKSTSIYGGVQLITIIAGVLRTKIAAIYLGTSGFGVLGILTTTLALISNFSNLGLSSSAVREVSKISLSNNNVELANLAKAINRSVFISGILGSLLMFFLSKQLSHWTFGNDNYVYAYMGLSIAVVLTNVYSGHYALLQGLRKIKHMAFAKILGALLGVLVVVPCYVIGGEKGIVPSMILTALIPLLVSRYFIAKIGLPKINQKISKTITIGKTSILLGFMMMTTVVIASLTELITKSFIGAYGSLSDVGLYQAGWALNTQYLGLVFTAMATDYFPRLTQVMSNKQNREQTSLMVNQQSEIAIIILFPLIIIMIVFLPTVIKLLYSSEFLSIITFTKLLLIGSLIKAGSWAISFMFLSAGDGKLYLINEVGIKIVNVPLYFICYYYGGLTAVGYGFIINYIIYFSWVAFMASNKYKLKLSKQFAVLLITTIIGSVLAYLIEMIQNYALQSLLSFVFISLSLGYAYYELNKRLNINLLMRKIFKK